MPTRASIAIFEGKSDESSTRQVKPFTPAEVFKAARRVIDSKGCELVRTNTGIYVVAYAENGPFQAPVSDDWLPVYICRLKKWESGGITKEEEAEFLASLDTPTQ
jgi:hypothetical protein